ncbi:codeine O-demethylase-like [Mercurialis annua]|uniref:codeine O-demethylase-like n=1 Tax=Mercurialis annua TaxID=3986 RepID=UPI002160992C|nr:codeine O-demethylase-like [Mercurialis annua]
MPATDGVGEGVDTCCCCLPLLETPVIDFALLASPSPCRQELDKLCSALSSFGCFFSINHGITNSFLDELQSVIKQFFALPMEEKQKYARGTGESREGYGEDDMVVDEGQPIVNCNHRLTLILSSEDQQQLTFWPQSPPNFRETLLEYTKKLQMINEVVLKAMAMSLNLEEHCFLDKYGDKPTLRARFNYFPPSSSNHLAIGLAPHTDPSAITIVLQDKHVEGLQFLKDDQWFRVPVIPDALLINIGDQLQIMSNGLFKPPVHRVVKNQDIERISLAVFCLPYSENEIEPVDGLVTETRPRHYKKVKNYFATFMQYYQGKSLIEALKINT